MKALSLETLKTQLDVSQETGEGNDPAIDWETLLETNSKLCAWMVVSGVSLSLPVVQADQGDPTYYLDHDFWNSPSSQGCPFADAEARSEKLHTIVFGHHITGTKLMFSALGNAWEKDRFGKLGSLLWMTRTGETELAPLCSSRVDKDYALITRSDFHDEDDLHTWLTKLLASSSVQADNAQSLVQTAHKAITLVTCSDPTAGLRHRCITTFVG